MLSIQKQISRYNHSARSEKAKFIVIHDVGAVSSAQANANYFCGGDRQASADFFVDSNTIIQIVDYHNSYSWAIGDGHGKYGKTNSNTVNIEMCLESDFKPSQATINNTLNLVRYLMSELGISIDCVLTHHLCTDKNCPQSFSNDNWAKWNEFKNRISSQPSRTQPTSGTICSFQHASNLAGLRDQNGNRLDEDNLAGAGGHTQWVINNKVWLHQGMTGELVRWLQNRLIALGFSCGSCGADGSFGNATLTALKLFQASRGLTIDGSCGPNTMLKLLGL